MKRWRAGSRDHDAAICNQETWLQRGPTGSIVLALLKKVRNLRYQGVPGGGKRFDSQSSYLYSRSFPARPRFPVKHPLLCK